MHSCFLSRCFLSRSTEGVQSKTEQGLLSRARKVPPCLQNIVCSSFDKESRMSQANCEGQVLPELCWQSRNSNCLRFEEESKTAFHLLVCTQMNILIRLPIDSAKKYTIKHVLRHDHILDTPLQLAGQRCHWSGEGNSTLRTYQTRMK